MNVTFDALPPTARVWIYQASRALTDAELVAVGPHLARFAAGWTSHGAALRAAAEFRHQQFLVVGLDEAVAGASGCSIDASVRFVGELEKALGLSLLDKSRLAFARPGGLLLLERRDLKPAVAAGTLGPATPYFDNTVATKAELAARWPAPAGRTWLARYFAPVAEGLAPGPALA
ncbi:hypothetical protein ACFQ48_04695 [Hymenobacter caeli]|uniref:ABC transporter ATPase n=1 Tax=Hymenobacter caeli TaxID=2735894 RepID=A0ABX2FQ09_9BACT|nr:hypothetical protein [Hymenobacter caeli]NRT19258.1 hypothetical protein [Hymenobacter caeli]